MQRLAMAVTIALAVLGALPASAQTQATAPGVFITQIPELPGALRRSVDPTAVVDRLLSFDADGDDRVTAAELPERMRSVVDRIDQDDDGFLTAQEIQASVDRRPAVVQRSTTILPSRVASGLLGAIQDLKLPQLKYDRAVAILENYRVPRNVNDPNSVDLAGLHAAMKDLLDEEEFGDFMAAAARPGVRRITFRAPVTIR